LEKGCVSAHESSTAPRCQPTSAGADAPKEDSLNRIAITVATGLGLVELVVKPFDYAGSAPDIEPIVLDAGRSR
jgi:hypothetical protein